MMRRLYLLYRLTEKIKRWFSARFTPLGKVILLTSCVAFFFGLSVQRTMIYQIFTITLCLLSFSYLFTLRFSTKFVISRYLPSSCVAGRKLNYTISIANGEQKAQKGLFIREAVNEYSPDWEEFSKSKEEGEEKRNFFDRKMKYYRWLWLLESGRSLRVNDQLLPNIPAGQAIEIDVEVFPLRRGNIHLTGHKITKLDPFGLCKREKYITNGENLMVLPKLYAVPQLFFEGSRRYHQGGISAARDRGDSNEFMSLREYVHGDPVKHIDWKSTARSGRTMVKQYRDEYFSRYGLVLDSFTSRKYCIRFEEAVSVAASVLMAQDNINTVLDLLFVGEECVTCSVGRGLAGHQRMLEILASVETCGDKTFAELAALVRSHSSLLSGIVVILIDIDKERSELINYLVAHDIPTKAVLLTDDKNAAEFLLTENQPDIPIRIIDVAQVEEQVMQL